MNIFIKRSEEGEIEAIKAISEKAYQTPYKENGLVTKFREVENLADKVRAGEIIIFAAHIQDELVGAVRCQIEEGDKMYLYKLAVLKEFRNQGVATALIAAVEAEAARSSCRGVKLNCVLEKQLQPFYEKRGYEAEEIRPHGDHHDIRMFKSFK